MLKAASNTRLFASIVFSILLIGFCLTMLNTSLVFGLAAGLCGLHSLILAIRLMDLSGPIVSATPEGLVFTDQISSQGLLPWDEVKSLRVVRLLALYSPFSWATYLLVSAPGKGYFDGTSWLLPPSWFGFYFLPTRLIEGGAAAAHDLVAVSEGLREPAESVFDSQLDDSAEWQAASHFIAPAVKNGAVGNMIANAAIDMVGGEGFHLFSDPTPASTRPTYHTPVDDKAMAAMVEAERARRAAAQPPTPASLGQKGVLLNGKPLK